MVVAALRMVSLGLSSVQMQGTSTVIDITGMTCGSCVSAIRSAVSQLSGISSVDISLRENRGTFLHNPAAVTAQDIAQCVEDCGFDVAIFSSEPQLGGPALHDSGRTGDTSFNFSIQVIIIRSVLNIMCQMIPRVFFFFVQQVLSESHLKDPTNFLYIIPHMSCTLGETTLHYVNVYYVPVHNANQKACGSELQCYVIVMKTRPVHGPKVLIIERVSLRFLGCHSVRQARVFLSLQIYIHVCTVHDIPMLWTQS